MSLATYAVELHEAGQHNEAAHIVVILVPELEALDSTVNALIRARA